MHRASSFVVVLPLAAFFGLLAAGSAGCSGAADSGVNGTPTSSASNGAGGLPCCHGGFIYKCASEDALAVCSDSSADDTTDCTKTATACGDSTTKPPATSSSSTTAPPPAPKKKTGEKCATEDECVGGHCLVFGAGSAGFCSSNCNSANDCPGQYSCELAPKLGVKVCVPNGNKKLGDSCTESIDCASTLCLTPSAGGVGYCSAACNAPADCGLSWSCAPVNGATGKYCQK
jgi:hypothetical protein